MSFVSTLVRRFLRFIRRRSDICVILFQTSKQLFRANCTLFIRLRTNIKAGIFLKSFSFFHIFSRNDVSGEQCRGATNGWFPPRRARRLKKVLFSFWYFRSTRILVLHRYLIPLTSLVFPSQTDSLIEFTKMTIQRGNDDKREKSSDNIEITGITHDQTFEG